MRRKIGFLFMCIGAAMLIAALSLLSFNRAEDKNAGKAAEEILPVLIGAIGEPEDGDDTDMDAVEIDGYGYIGYLSIPALGLELPVMDEWDYTRLKTAPCRYTGSVETGDLVICGHNYTRHFGTLKNLQPGDLVFFTGMDKTTSVYEVNTVEILQPDQVEEMIGSGYDLTLYTCTYGGQSRVTVRCRRTE